MPRQRTAIAIIIFFTVLILLIFPVRLRSLARNSVTTPGPYMALAFKAPLTPSPTFTYTPTPSYGILLVSEVMAHPAGAEPDGEWVELYNSGGAAIDLSTYKLGDEETRGQGEGIEYDYTFCVHLLTDENI